MIREYEEKDLDSIIKLFYDTVHFININITLMNRLMLGHLKI